MRSLQGWALGQSAQATAGQWTLIEPRAPRGAWGCPGQGGSEEVSALNYVPMSLQRPALASCQPQEAHLQHHEAHGSSSSKAHPVVLLNNCAVRRQAQSHQKEHTRPTPLDLCSEHRVDSGKSLSARTVDAVTESTCVQQEPLARCVELGEARGQEGASFRERKSHAHHLYGTPGTEPGGCRERRALQRGHSYTTQSFCREQGS